MNAAVFVLDLLTKAVVVILAVCFIAVVVLGGCQRRRDLIDGAAPANPQLYFPEHSPTPIGKGPR